MSDRIADFIIKLAEDADARVAFRASPKPLLAHLDPSEEAAVLSGDDGQVIALAQRARPIVGKILGGMDEQPEGAPVVAKILGGMNDEPEDAVVAKILGGFDDEQRQRRRA
jgi:hypothetical protein